MKDYKERFDEIFANRKVIGDRTFKDYHEYLYADILDFIDQIISERDKDVKEEIYFHVTNVARMTQQTVGEKNDYYITLQQLEALLND